MNFSHGRPRAEGVYPQAAGIGPSGPLPLTIYSRLPSRLRLTEFGYQPVGINPATRPAS